MGCFWARAVPGTAPWVGLAVALVLASCAEPERGTNPQAVQGRDTLANGLVAVNTLPQGDTTPRTQFLNDLVVDVRQPDGAPIYFAEMRFDTLVEWTDPQGQKGFDTIPLNGQRVVLRLSHPAYFPLIVPLLVDSLRRGYRLDVVMTPRERIGEANPLAETTLGNGPLQLTLPPRAFFTADRALYSQPVRVFANASPQTPTTRLQQNPGGAYAQAISATTGQVGVLDPAAAFWIAFEAEDGSPALYRLLSGLRDNAQPANVAQAQFALDAETRQTLGPQTTLWQLDDQGVWHPRGTATQTETGYAFNLPGGGIWALGNWAPSGLVHGTVCATGRPQGYGWLEVEGYGRIRADANARFRFQYPTNRPLNLRTNAGQATSPQPLTPGLELDLGPVGPCDTTRTDTVPRKLLRYTYQEADTVPRGDTLAFAGTANIWVRHRQLNADTFELFVQDRDSLFSLYLYASEPFCNRPLPIVRRTLRAFFPTGQAPIPPGQVRGRLLYRGQDLRLDLGEVVLNENPVTGNQAYNHVHYVATPTQAFRLAGYTPTGRRVTVTLEPGFGVVCP